MPPAKKPNGRLGDAVWASMRDEYVTGNESYAEIAKRYGVTKNAVQKHAQDRAHPVNGGRTWTEWRSDLNRRTSDKVEEQTSEAAARTLAEVRELSVEVSKLALTELKRRATPSSDGVVLMESRDLVQTAKLATTIKIELSGGDPNQPVRVEQSLDQLTLEELRKLVEAK